VARFFFNLHENGAVLRDEEGIEYPDIGAVHRSALDTARDVMRGDLSMGHLCLGSHIEVLDERGRSVFMLAFEDAVVIYHG
jgi:hypothetical protein